MSKKEANGPLIGFSLKKPDLGLCFCIVALISCGVISLASVSAAISYDRFQNTYYYLNHQLLYGLVPGLILGFLAFSVNITFLKRIALPVFLLTLVLMGLTFVPGIGSKMKGAQRWIDLGPVTFQPSELLKLSFILYFASLLEKWTSIKKDFTHQTLIPFLMIIGITAFFVLAQRDLSTFAIILMAAIIMYFLSGTPFWHLLVILCIGFLAFGLLIIFEPYRLSRLTVLFNGTNTLSEGYQLNQSLIAIGSGGIFGTGLGMSKQRFGFLPEAMSDAIFPILAEETGFIGSAFLILLFLAFLWRCFKIVKGNDDKFQRLVSAGIGSWIVIQAFVNIGAMAGILPIAGIPLPFLSYGGSALIAELIAVGVLLNTSKNQ